MVIESVTVVLNNIALVIHKLDDGDGD